LWHEVEAIPIPGHCYGTEYRVHEVSEDSPGPTSRVQCYPHGQGLIIHPQTNEGPTQQREWGLVCNIIYLSCSKIIFESKGGIVTHLDNILALALQHYCNCIVEKDKNLKLEYLGALSKLTNIISNQPMAFQFKFVQKLEIVTFMVELIKEEPLNSISSSVRLRAMNIITDFRNLSPLTEVEERTDLLRTCCKSVLCLPPTEVLLKEESSSQEAEGTVVMISLMFVSL
uniref:MROH2B-like HEAT-repeats domain-containing protein n=1 Tax=Mustela putorius furo TaxID=9669 RepID=M3YGS5_MUSPF